MAKLGSRKRPAVVRVKTEIRAMEILEFCVENGWQVIVGIEPDEMEDISDVEKLINPSQPSIAHFKRGRNEACFCGSGKKYKKCCVKI